MSNTRKRQRPTVVDLFCGAGGLSLGFEQAGFDVVLGIDADGHHVAAHHRNFPYSKTICMSVTDLDAKKVRELTGLAEIDCIVGGPPCQGFSSMGHRDVADPRNTLIGEFARVVLEVRPKAFVMENVPAMLSGDTRPLLDAVIDQFERGGYKITKPLRTLTASDFGVPQARTRLIVIGVLSKLETDIGYPESRCKGQPPRPTVGEAIADLPSIEKHENLFKEDITEYDAVPAHPYAKVARGLLRDPSDLSRPRIWNRKKCSGCMRVRHSASSVELYRATPPGTAVPGHKLPRLDPSGLAPTLRAGSDSTRGSYTAPRPIHPFLPRCITAREAARLHGYPDWFSFFPTKWHAYKQIGNSVCPPVGRAIGAEVANALQLGRRPMDADPVRLGDVFHLPDDRPRQKRRIPQVREYPPVIAHLFNSRFDPASGSMRDGRFAFSDVQEAIKATGANLHWTRADTFLDEVARSRNVALLLAPALQRGYSMRRLDTAPWIGEFVPTGTAGTVDDKDFSAVRIRELTHAVPLDMSANTLTLLETRVPVLLAQKSVVTAIWNGRSSEVTFKSGQGTNLHVGSYKAGGGEIGVAVLIASQDNIPNRVRIDRVFEQTGAAEVVSFTRLTSQHLLASRYERDGGTTREIVRRVFRLKRPRKPAALQRGT